MSVFDRLKTWWLFRGHLDTGRNRIWAQWANAKAVYGEAVGYGALRPFENRLVGLLIERHPNHAGDFFGQGLKHPNPSVVGYSLLGLALLDRDLLRAMEIPDSGRKITWCYACFGTDCSLERLREIILER